MTPEQRQLQILRLVGLESGISAGRLARHFQVSRMTIHRDLSHLVEKKLLLRIHGGAVAKPLTKNLSDARCPVCARPLVPHQGAELQAPDGGVSVACCAACGLRQLLLSGDGFQISVRDMISGCQVPGDEAFFLVNSLASPCCQPSFLSFSDEQEAVLFQAGFGGSVARLKEALEFLRVSEGLSDR